jgi:hypothetical protein
VSRLDQWGAVADARVGKLRAVPRRAEVDLLLVLLPWSAVAAGRDWRRLGFRQCFDVTRPEMVPCTL